MDCERFDALARTLSAGVFRRRALAGFAAALLSQRLARAEPAAVAECRGSGRPCGSPSACCPDSRCLSGRCRCKVGAGFRPCDGPGFPCTDTNASERHCGNCGAPCPRRHACRGGRCVDHCQSEAKDGDESDVDCGGDRCPKCGLDKRCRDDGDCKSGRCAGGVCVACKTDAHCAPLAPLAPVCVDNACRQCRQDAHCNANNPLCINNNCEQCEFDRDCLSAKPFCDRIFVCRECLQDSHCPGDGVCVLRRCGQCRGDADCPATKPICDANHRCRPSDTDTCGDNADCPAGTVNNTCCDGVCGKPCGDDGDCACGGLFHSCVEGVCRD